MEVSSVEIWPTNILHRFIEDQAHFGMQSRAAKNEFGPQWSSWNRFLFIQIQTLPPSKKISILYAKQTLEYHRWLPTPDDVDPSNVVLECVDAFSPFKYTNLDPYYWFAVGLQNMSGAGREVKWCYEHTRVAVWECQDTQTLCIMQREVEAVVMHCKCQMEDGMCNSMLQKWRFLLLDSTPPLCWVSLSLPLSASTSFLTCFKAL